MSEDRALILHLNNVHVYVEAKGISFEIWKLINRSKSCTREEIIEKLFPGHSDKENEKNLDALMNKFVELKILEFDLNE